MAWLVIDKSKRELITSDKPSRWKYGLSFSTRCQVVRLPEGTIEKLIGRKLTIDDGPVEI